MQISPATPRYTSRYFTSLNHETAIPSTRPLGILFLEYAGNSKCARRIVADCSRGSFESAKNVPARRKVPRIFFFYSQHAGHARKFQEQKSAFVPHRHSRTAGLRLFSCEYLSKELLGHHILRETELEWYAVIVLGRYQRAVNLFSRDMVRAADLFAQLWWHRSKRGNNRNVSRRLPS